MGDHHVVNFRMWSEKDSLTPTLLQACQKEVCDCVLAGRVDSFLKASNHMLGIEAGTLWLVIGLPSDGTRSCNGRAYGRVAAKERS